jgi:GNAT superfamily N-acetyltransferase
MLVRLYDIPEPSARIAGLHQAGIDLRRAIAPERHVVVSWVREQFGEGWASECEVSFARLPISCFRAQRGQDVLGFACYDATAKAFFGPTGVLESERNKGIGTALLLMALQAMAADGYAYAIIGAAGPAEFYANTVGAVPIEGSTPGIYAGMLRSGRPPGQEP